MNRLGFAVATLLALAGAAAAAEKAPYSVSAEAKRADGKILVSVKIMEIKEQAVANAGITDVTTQLSSPRIILTEGQQAIIESGDSVPTANDPHPADITSGFKVEIISVQGGKELVMVAMVMDKGTIVWVDASRVGIK